MLRGPPVPAYIEVFTSAYPRYASLTPPRPVRVSCRVLSIERHFYPRRARFPRHSCPLPHLRTQLPTYISEPTPFYPPLSRGLTSTPSSIILNHVGVPTQVWVPGTLDNHTLKSETGLPHRLWKQSRRAEWVRPSQRKVLTSSHWLILFGYSSVPPFSTPYLLIWLFLSFAALGPEPCS